MVKAMYSGVSGLKAHQSKMDVIGNNIANVNTWGYKAMDTSFKESIYQVVNTGSAGSTTNGGYGGVNPSMVGYGSMVSTISANFTSGNQVPTGRDLDMYIDGTAFFMVGPMYGEGESKTPGDMYLSRVGDFNVVNGYLVDGNGRYVYGCSMSKGGEIYSPKATSDVKNNGEVEIKLPEWKNGNYKSEIVGKTGKVTTYERDPAFPDGSKMIVKTFRGSVANDLDLTDPANIDILNELEGMLTGGKKIVIPDPADSTKKIVDVDALAEAVKEFNDRKCPVGETGTDGKKYLYMVDTKNNKSQIMKVTLDETNDVDSGVEIPIPEPEIVKQADGTTITTSWEAIEGKPGKVTEKVTTVTPAEEGAEHKGPQFDEGRLTFSGEDGSYTMAEGMGTMAPLKIPTSCTFYDKSGKAQTEENIIFSSFSINKEGMIYGTSASSQRTYLLGSVALVNVDNPNGMKKDGSYYQLGGSSGTGNIVQAGGITGTLQGGYLESANVDIATEFSNMITTERGFQANSKIITVTDEMLQELVNMKR